MDPKTLLNHQLVAALGAAMEAVKEARGSKGLKAARTKALFALKQEAQLRVNRGEW